MILESLYEKIQLLQARIRSHRLLYASNEYRTRIGLIDPLLCELGWDVSDPNSVGIEYGIGAGQVDYALLKSVNNPVVILDAKKLDEPLEKHRNQIAIYVFQTSAKYVGLTNGDHWEIYDKSKRGNYNDQRILDLKISSSEVHEVVMKMLFLWRSNTISAKAMIPNVPVMDANTTTATQVSNAPATNTNVAPAVQTPPSTDWIKLGDCKTTKGSPRPTSIRFWDGTIKPISNWYEVLTLTVEKIYEDLGDKVADECPIESSKNRYIIHKEAIHPTSQPFRSCKEVGSIFVEAHSNARDTLNNSRTIIQKFDFNPDDCYLKIK